jgi:hypothetical protein
MLQKSDLVHHFKTTSHDIIGLFNKTNKISTFMSKLEKQAQLDTDRYPYNDYVGDGFEFLMEIFTKTHAFDNRIGITNYVPVNSNEDNGVDATGLNISGEKCVIQHKYRSNNQSFLSANKDHLSNMFSAAQTTYGIQSLVSEKETLTKYFADEIISKSKFEKQLAILDKSAPRHYVFTTAKNLHHFTDNEMYKNQVVCIGFDDLKVMLQDNLSFWNLCRELVK